MLFLSSHIPKHHCLTFECQRKTTISTENLTVLMHLDWTELNRTGLDRLDWTFEKKIGCTLGEPSFHSLLYLYPSSSQT